MKRRNYFNYLKGSAKDLLEENDRYRAFYPTSTAAAAPQRSIWSDMKNGAKNLGNSIVNSASKFGSKITNDPKIAAATGAAIGGALHLYDVHDAKSDLSDLMGKNFDAEKINKDTFNSNYEQYKDLYNKEGINKFDANNDGYLDKNELHKLYNTYKNDTSWFPWWNDADDKISAAKEYYDYIQKTPAMDFNKDGIVDSNDTKAMKDVDRVVNSSLPANLMGGAAIGGALGYGTNKLNSKLNSKFGGHS